MKFKFYDINNSLLTKIIYYAQHLFKQYEPLEFIAINSEQELFLDLEQKTDNISVYLFKVLEHEEFELVQRTRLADPYCYIVIVGKEELLFHSYEYGIEAISYVKTPLVIDKLMDALDTILKRSKQVKAKIQHNLSSHIHVKSGSIYQSIYIQEITYVEYVDRKIIYHTTRNQEIISIVGKTLKEALLEANKIREQFYMVSINSFVNINYARKLDSANNTLELTTGEILQLSRQGKYKMIKIIDIIENL